MKAIHAVFAELFSLFVDDGMLAALTLILIAIATALTTVMQAPTWTGGALLFFGVIAILAESVLRASRKKKP
ncbi:hypothetical protein NAC44_20285 [Allorhizobium sp. BGMRC 0089]|uniref:hypothetical protein n=1 Tax=Allorhizobium sonneratiae TaxID=2934936 RepID=UPI0020344A33|nr:hypothetical protein [Allorhizobium sonneratiae]MCM2294670.1 hypothetical protein [Allorhizobium sonneratiae]